MAHPYHHSESSARKYSGKPKIISDTSMVDESKRSFLITDIVL